MATKEFGEARREMKSVLASVERRCLVWLAARLPSWINSDHLTVLALVAMLATGMLVLRVEIQSHRAGRGDPRPGGELVRRQPRRDARAGFAAISVRATVSTSITSSTASACCSSCRGWRCPAR